MDKCSCNRGFQLKRVQGRRSKGKAISTRHGGCLRSVHKQALAFLFFPMEVNSVSLHTDEVTQEKEEINPIQIICKRVIAMIEFHSDLSSEKV